jgi:hypothetical protein
MFSWDAYPGLEEKMEGITSGPHELFRFMVSDARTMIENGCNWTAALVLLCFTEACGKLYVVEHLRQCGEHARRNFHAFLRDCMRCPDADRLAGELYGDVRCGLAHGFFLLNEKHRLRVYVGTDSGPLEENGFDVRNDSDGRQVWYFACMPYFKRFVDGLEVLALKLGTP